MKEYVDALLDSMLARDPGRLPLASRYAATENSVAGSLNMMTGWRTITGVNAIGHRVVDGPRGTVFFTASLDEGGNEVMFWARIAVHEGVVTELEMYRVASRAEAGFVLLADQVATPPAAWTSPIPEDGRATREELEELARAIYDANRPAPASADDCVLMELGGIVLEDPDYIDLLMHGEVRPRDSDEKVTIPGGLGAGRPTDPRARVVAVDEEQGIAVASGIVRGYVSPYVTSAATESCFVPASMIDMHRRTLETDWPEGRVLLREMPAVSAGTELVRLHSGKIQGVHLLNSLTAPGAVSPWVD